MTLDKKLFNKKHDHQTNYCSP